MKKRILLFTIIFLEGYLALSYELLFIRQLIPFIGNQIETTSIIISSVLLPLSIGYYYGGNIIKKNFKKKLIKNLYIILTITSLGLSYFILSELLNLNTFDNVKLIVLIYSIFFIIYPFFLIGQTIPLISNYFKKNNISKLTGKMLFFSTFGSFLGSVFSTIFLMSKIGVNNTIIFNIIIISIIILILHKTNVKNLLFLFIISSFSIFINSNFLLLKYKNIVLNNEYNIIEIINKNNAKILNLNNSYCAIKDIKTNNSLIWYINKSNLIIKNIKKDKKLNILVIGSAGFQIGENDNYNNYIFVDIDKNIKRISELYFIGNKLSKNKKFIPISTRLYFNQNKNKKFDIIILDAYTNKITIPYQLLTINFLNLIKNKINKDGYFISNIITSPFNKNGYSLKLDNTFNTVFYPIIKLTPPYIDFKEINNPKYITNVMYIWHNDNIIKDKKILTDDKML